MKLIFFNVYHMKTGREFCDMPASELGHNIYIYFSKKLQAIFLNFKLQIKYLEAYTAY